MPPFEDSAAFAALAADLQSQPDAEVTARLIVSRLAELVPDADHVSVTVRNRNGFETLAATDEIALKADSAQYSLDEGPCRDAAEQASWLRSGDVGNDRRWPNWGPQARDLGVESLLAVHLFHEERQQGALNLYSRRAGAFGERDVIDLALIYAMHAANALNSARLVAGLQTAMSSRHTIGMAQGILMERYDLDEHRSFELLRRISSSNEIKVRDAAARLVADRDALDFTD